LIKSHVVRIGGASGAWGDSPIAVPQLLREGRLDYLVFDYLGERTLAMLAAARSLDPDAGYAPDFIQSMTAHLPEIMRQGVRIIANAGGVNPRSCAAALRRVASQLDLSPRIGLVTGEDAMVLAQQLGDLPDHLVSASAYFGAVTIAHALDAGADIVVTGRCVDSAPTLGALMHEFGWRDSDHDLLAAGSLAGHVIECGCQATGALYTDWEDIPDWAGMGYPILEVEASGAFTVTKPDGTGGRVIVPAIAEQILYEVGDPSAYILPDVICDFTHVRLEQTGIDRVRVDGARGSEPTSSYKVSITYQDGFNAHMQLTVIGFDADRKARRAGEAILERSRHQMMAAGFADFDRHNIEVLGAEDVYGPHRQLLVPRECVLRLSVSHQQASALLHFAAELGAAGIAYSPGVTGLGAKPVPVMNIRLTSRLIDKAALVAAVEVDGQPVEVRVPSGKGQAPIRPEPQPESGAAIPGDWKEVPLIAIAHGRSGDKGDTSNIAVIARRPEYLPLIHQQVTPSRVAAYMAHLIRGKIRRFDVPGLDAVNFLCEEALDGGVAGSLRNDPWGKGYAQVLLSMPVRIPAELDADRARG